VLTSSLSLSLSLCTNDGSHRNRRRVEEEKRKLEAEKRKLAAAAAINRPARTDSRAGPPNRWTTTFLLDSPFLSNCFLSRLFFSCVYSVRLLPDDARQVSSARPWRIARRAPIAARARRAGQQGIICRNQRFSAEPARSSTGRQSCTLPHSLLTLVSPP
jgi:hypothetical protein